MTISKRDWHQRQFRNELLTAANRLKERRESGRIPKSVADELDEQLTNLDNLAQNADLSSREDS